MTVQKRDKAVQAVDVLNDFIGDLVGGTNLFRYWESKAEKVRVPKDVMLNVRKICLSHLVLSLHTFVEFYKRFKPNPIAILEQL